MPRSARGAVCRLGSRTVLEGRDAVLDMRLMIGSRAAEMPGGSRAELVSLSVHLAVCGLPLMPMSGRPLVA
jgi:hypothetical protein